MAILNEVTYFIDSGLRTTREAEAPDADWDGGVNFGASCAPALGVNTGNYNPDPSNWAYQDERIQDSNTIGGTASGVNVQDPILGDGSLAVWTEATAPVAPDAQISTVSGFPVYNRTGATVPTGAWLWGVGDNP